jgi:DNA-binding transcriptional MerR regulator
MNPTTQQWSTAEVSKSAGVTSRTLRYYESIALLEPRRIGTNGLRFYGMPELARLHRVLSLRELGLSLDAIKATLDDDLSLEDALRAHLALLEEDRHRTTQRIAAAKHSLAAINKGETMSVKELFAGFDHMSHEQEVRQRWGDQAWERSLARDEAMRESAKRTDREEDVRVNQALRDAAESGLAADTEAFQRLIGEHYLWVQDRWGGRAPKSDEYRGLAELYVADPRFSRVYGGQTNAKTIRSAINIWAQIHLA